MIKDTQMTMLEFFKKEPATHPQHGYTLPYTAVEVYLYPKHWRQTEYGVDTGMIRYNPGLTRAEAVRRIKKLMFDEGYTLKSHTTKEADYTGAAIMSALMIQP
jgi:hypothetical protein